MPRALEPRGHRETIILLRHGCTHTDTHRTREPAPDRCHRPCAPVTQSTHSTRSASVATTWNQNGFAARHLHVRARRREPDRAQSSLPPLPVMTSAARRRPPRHTTCRSAACLCRSASPSGFPALAIAAAAFCEGLPAGALPSGHAAWLADQARSQHFWMLFSLARTNFAAALPIACWHLLSVDPPRSGAGCRSRGRWLDRRPLSRRTRCRRRCRCSRDRCAAAGIRCSS
mgnify:CR=1 FL=1